MFAQIQNTVVSCAAQPHCDNQYKAIYDPFATASLCNEEEPESVLKQQKSIIHKEVVCQLCNIPLYKSPADMAYICKECGRMEEMVGVIEDGGTESISNYNTSDDAAAPVRINGPDSYLYQKKLIGNIANYKKTQKKNTKDQMIQIVSQYNGYKIPQGVVVEAANFYYEVQQHCIKRGDVRKGAMAACLYRMCIKHNITRKPKEISDIFGIAQSELSNGEKILDDLIARGLIKAQETQNQETTAMDSFLNRYFEVLGIPAESTQPNGPKYRTFATRLILFTTKYNIAASSITSSKCAGAVYILASKCGELNIKRDQIEKECVISKSTFSRFFREIMEIINTTEPRLAPVKSRLINIFKKNNIPLK